MKIEIEIIARLVKVRCARSKNDTVRLWDELSQGDIHVASRLTYDDLVTLGDGIHEV